MKIDSLVAQLQKIRDTLGNVEVAYIDMRFGNAPVTWDHTVRTYLGDEKCYIEIQGESDPKYGNLDARGREVLRKSTE